MKRIVVDSNGSGDFSTVAEAVENAESGCEIFVKNGAYREKIVADKPNISIIGEDSEKTIIVYGDYAMMEREVGYPIGTFKTPTLFVTESAEGFLLKNITVWNDAGEGNVVGQAVALYIDCDKGRVENCRLIARQDTLLAGPIPEDITRKPMPVHRQYFKNCYIEGNVDFIFGGAVAVFENCDIFIVGRSGFPGGYVTAGCHDESFEYGYVFKNCRITGSGNRKYCYLGRPWRGGAKTVFINCLWDDIIHPEVFAKWNDTPRHTTCYYAFSGMEDFAKTKADWVHILKNTEEYSEKNIFKDWEI